MIKSIDIFRRLAISSEISAGRTKVGATTMVISKQTSNSMLAVIKLSKGEI
jgi:hypothetical protein